MNSETLGEGTLVYPRLTAEYLKSLISFIQYDHVPQARTTICTVMLEHEFALTVSVVCPSAELYDQATGEKHALHKMLAAIREREYYVLRRMLHQEKLSKTGV